MFLIADNLQITKPAIAKAIEARDPKPVMDLVSRCEAAGAQAIDVNTGPLSKDGEAKMAFLVECVQTACSLPLSLDTVNPKAMEAGLKLAKKRPIINGISLHPQKLKDFIPLAQKFDADLVCFLLKPDGHVPKDAPGRLETAVELVSALAEAGINGDRLIIDPIAAPLMWDDGGQQAVEVLETVRLLPEILGFDVRVMAGISNLTTGSGPLSKKLLMERTYLAMLQAAGLWCTLLNIFHAETVLAARAGDVLCSGKVFSWHF